MTVFGKFCEIRLLTVYEIEISTDGHHPIMHIKLPIFRD